MITASMVTASMVTVTLVCSACGATATASSSDPGGAAALDDAPGLDADDDAPEAETDGDLTTVTGDGAGPDASGSDGAGGDAGGTDGTDAPIEPPLTECPDPDGNYPGQGRACVGTFSCEWGHECCCNTCSPASECRCVAGTLQCNALDTCLWANCSPGCDFDQYQTPEGCTNYHDILATVGGMVEASVAGHTGCAADLDCALVTPNTGCGARCPVGVTASDAEAVATVITETTAPWCVSLAGSYWASEPCPESPVAVCLDGTCASVATCDPTVFPAGWPCDDGDPCTLGDACASGACAGGPAVDCDDENPCTADTCGTDGACNHTAAPGPCAGGSACSLGGGCTGGQCVDSGLIGWRAVYERPDTQNATVIIALPEGGWIFAGRETSAVPGTPVKARLIAVDDGGTVAWERDWAGDASAIVTAEATAQAGEVAVAGNGLVRRFAADGTPGDIVSVASEFSDGPHAMVAVGTGLVLAGATSPTPNVWNLRVLRLSATDQTLWSKDLGASNGYGRSILAASGDGVVVGAMVTAPVVDIGDIADVRLLRLDANGATVADTIIGPSDSNDVPAGLVALPGGDVLLAIASLTYGKDDKSATGTLRRLDAANTELWKRDFEESYTVVGLDGDAVVVAAGTESYEHEVRLRRIGTDGSDLGQVVIPSVQLHGSWITAEAFAGGRAALLATTTGGVDGVRDLGLTVVTPCFAAPCAVTCK